MNVKPSSLTTMHAVIAIVAFVAVGVGCKLLGLPDIVSGFAATGVALLLQSLGLIQAGDAASLEKTASDLSEQVNKGIAEVKVYTTNLHMQSIANDAVLHTAVAVQAATAGATPPPPLAVPLVSAPVDPVEQAPHLVP
jgi:hypothetical protein